MVRVEAVMGLVCHSMKPGLSFSVIPVVSVRTYDVCIVNVVPEDTGSVEFMTESPSPWKSTKTRAPEFDCTFIWLANTKEAL
jgi:hypothetical protein